MEANIIITVMRLESMYVWHDKLEVNASKFEVMNKANQMRKKAKPNFISTWTHKYQPFLNFRYEGPTTFFL